MNEPLLIGLAAGGFLALVAFAFFLGAAFNEWQYEDEDEDEDPLEGCRMVVRFFDDPEDNGQLTVNTRFSMLDTELLQHAPHALEAIATVLRAQGEKREHTVH